MSVHRHGREHKCGDERDGHPAGLSMRYGRGVPAGAGSIEAIQGNFIARGSVFRRLLQ